MKEKIELLKSWIATGQVVTQEGRNIDDLMTLVNQIELSSIGGEEKTNLFEHQVCAMCKISLNAIVEKGEEKTLDEKPSLSCPKCNGTFFNIEVINPHTWEIECSPCGTKWLTNPKKIELTSEVTVTPNRESGEPNTEEDK